MTDLIGKKIACDFPHLRLLADAALLEDGVSPTSVRWVPWRGSDMNGEEMSLSLASGDVDALFVIDWNDGDFAARGMPLRHLSSKLLNRLRLSSCYWANTTALSTKHDLIARGLRVLTRSLVYAMENPERTIEMAWDHFPEMRPPNTDQEFAFRRDVEILKARLAPMTIEPTDSSTEWGYMSADEFQHLQDCLVQTGALARPVDVSTCFTTEFLKDFNDLSPESIPAVRIA
jgi:ABC-type nitrate/sulfonate/bicarbonate transport system substrate-binding protein